MAKEKKPCAKKTCAKKTTEKKVEAKAEKKVEKKAVEKKVDEKAKPLTKTQIIAQLAENSGLSKKDVSAVVDGIGALIQSSLAEADSFTLPGLVKIEKQWVPEKPGQENVPDPFHPGQTTNRPAKPAHWKIKVKALKALKDMV
ncbi:MAG: HU family DNA-binding protein [Thermoguttaceae bacterium]|nr:HU family DNA-binding protein [Thermoguttaceae bacterium]MBQ7109984.1 HU family DNA-binding protein [Thermoguttaceae bacterium]